MLLGLPFGNAKQRLEDTSLTCRNGRLVLEDLKGSVFGGGGQGKDAHSLAFTLFSTDPTELDSAVLAEQHDGEQEQLQDLLSSSGPGAGASSSIVTKTSLVSILRALDTSEDGKDVTSDEKAWSGLIDRIFRESLHKAEINSFASSSSDGDDASSVDDMSRASGEDAHQQMLQLGGSSSSFASFQDSSGATPPSTTNHDPSTDHLTTTDAHPTDQVTTTHAHHHDDVAMRATRTKSIMHSVYQNAVLVSLSKGNVCAEVPDDLSYAGAHAQKGRSDTNYLHDDDEDLDDDNSPGGADVLQRVEHDPLGYYAVLGIDLKTEGHLFRPTGVNGAVDRQAELERNELVKARLNDLRTLYRHYRARRRMNRGNVWLLPVNLLWQLLPKTAARLTLVQLAAARRTLRLPTQASDWTSQSSTTSSSHLHSQHDDIQDQHGVEWALGGEETEVAQGRDHHERQDSASQVLDNAAMPTRSPHYARLRDDKTRSVESIIHRIPGIQRELRLRLRREADSGDTSSTQEHEAQPPHQAEHGSSVYTKLETAERVLQQMLHHSPRVGGEVVGVVASADHNHESLLESQFHLVEEAFQHLYEERARRSYERMRDQYILVGNHAVVVASLAQKLERVRQCFRVPKCFWCSVLPRSDAGKCLLDSTHGRAFIDQISSPIAPLEKGLVHYVHELAKAQGETRNALESFHALDGSIARYNTRMDEARTVLDDSIPKYLHNMGIQMERYMGAKRDELTHNPKMYDPGELDGGEEDSDSDDAEEDEDDEAKSPDNAASSKKKTSKKPKKKKNKPQQKKKPTIGPKATPVVEMAGENVQTMNSKAMEQAVETPEEKEEREAEEAEVEEQVGEAAKEVQETLQKELDKEEEEQKEEAKAVAEGDGSRVDALEKQLDDEEKKGKEEENNRGDEEESNKKANAAVEVEPPDEDDPTEEEIEELRRQKREKRLKKVKPPEPDEPEEEEPEEDEEDVEEIKEEEEQVEEKEGDADADAGEKEPTPAKKEEKKEKPPEKDKPGKKKTVMDPRRKVWHPYRLDQAHPQIRTQLLELHSKSRGQMLRTEGRPRRRKKSSTTSGGQEEMKVDTLVPLAADENSDAMSSSSTTGAEYHHRHHHHHKKKKRHSKKHHYQSEQHVEEEDLVGGGGDGKSSESKSGFTSNVHSLFSSFFSRGVLGYL
ncbi:unnamed protein product [Amoebophrya sp. A25]|nr:unnamed protein product [Amoebophrya sp. A25]|eukprot:GSA25T00020619001.1